MRLVLVVVAALLPAAGLAAAEQAKQSPAAAGPSRQGIKEGFKSLFDGRTLEGWQGSVKGYVPEGGVLVCQKKGGGKLFTKKEYANFVLRFEFKLEPGGNNGIAIRAPMQGHTSRAGMEIQVLDDDAERYKHLKPYQYHGSVYGMVPAKRGHLKPPGQWNQEEILCDGPHVKVTLNGTVIVDADLSRIPDPPMDGQPHPGRLRKTGYVGFIGHGSRVEFRNVRIKELPDS